MLPENLKPRFATILASRGNDSRPSDLEFGLRPHCQRLIVKGTPLSGAHLLLATERIAIRAYYPCDIHELIEEEGRNAKKQSVGRQSKDGCSVDSKNIDFDGLKDFFSSFQLALVLFIMPPDNNRNNKVSIMQQLDDTNSHFHRAQHLSNRYQRETGTACSTNRNGSSKNKTSDRKSIVMILPDTESAIENIIAVADSMTQERKSGKNALFQRLETKYFLPPIHSNSDSSTSASKLIQRQANETNAAKYVVAKLCEIERTFDLPSGEANILRELESLRAIATADDSLLETIPIDQRTRKVLHALFGSSLGSQKGTSRPRLPFQEQEQSLHQRSNLQDLSSIKARLFPQSTPPPSSFSTPMTSSGRPHPFRAHRHTAQAQLSHQDSFNPNEIEEFPSNLSDGVAANTTSFFHGNDEAMEFDDTFDFTDNARHVISLPSQANLPLSNPNNFSAIHPPFSSSCDERYGISPNRIPSGQSYYEEPGFHPPPMQYTQHYHQHQMRQPSFINHHYRPESTTHRNRLNQRAPNYQNSNSGQQFPSTRQWHHPLQQQHYS